MTDLKWNEGELVGTYFLAFAPLAPGGFEATVERLKALGAVDEGPGDKTTVEFRGTFKGAPFGLYDYYGDRRLHIGGVGDRDHFRAGSKRLDVVGLKAELARVLR